MVSSLNTRDLRVKYALDSLFVETVGCLTLKDINLAVSNRVHDMTHNRSPYCIEAVTCILSHKIIKPTVIPKKFKN